ncbi:hypothetical protein FRACYDRAFT_250790 [Fragilariopsis cylindrus CCMP1102]|uniref:Uncharacterized protein n=1 Tax=Fragilariopsis cylindrus CCMP1102 TaxID=635003 RepID=A0A1E7EPI4_9STRA|nr:hypothetical protein FRACYDRAFT_250790 [Fragilariopsis cylindrus CCMP1102]|eukprot:OEU07764.1 hypothetical protein FRACYDRAFT_250790 [Fragilariopsis cylindrus CCMP1102]
MAEGPKRVFDRDDPSKPHRNAQRCAIKFLHATAITENVALAAQVAMFMPTRKHTVTTIALAAPLMVGKKVHQSCGPKLHKHTVTTIALAAPLMVGKKVHQSCGQKLYFCPRTVVIALFV